MSSCVNCSGSPRGDLDLRPHDVDAGDELGDRVLDLDARVHLHEVVGAVGREQAFDRARGAVAGGAGRVDRDPTDPVAQLGVDGRRRRLLDQLLVAALDRAVALAEVDDVPVRVGEHLNLDVARVLEVLLDVDGRVGEVREPLALGRREGRRGLVGRVHDLHPFPAAARGRLDQQRVADLLAERDDLSGRRDRLGRARNDRHACGLHRLSRARLRAHQLDRGGRRADPDEARRLDGARERGVLGEEAVPGMDRPGARAGSRGEQLRRHQIALRRCLAAERVGLVGVARMQRGAVRVGVDGDRAEPQIAERAEDANRNLAAVRHQDLRERAHSGLFCRVVRLADQLTLARVIAVPLVIVLFAVNFTGHDYWATGVFIAAMATDWFDGRIARRSGVTSAFGSLVDPMADKLLVLATLIVLLDQHVFPGWMVATIVTRELLVSGLRLAAVERGSSSPRAISAS